MQLNNKGYLLVEVIITFVLVMTITYFLIDVTLSLIKKNNQIYNDTSWQMDKEIMTKVVMNDIMQYHLQNIINNGTSIDFVFTEETKRLEIVSNNHDQIFKYGNDNHQFVKKLDSELTISDFQVTTKCFNGTAYTTNCEDSNTSKTITNLQIPIFDKTTNKHYDFNLELLY